MRLMYAHDTAAGEKHERAKTLVEELWRNWTGVVHASASRTRRHLRKKSRKPPDARATREVILTPSRIRFRIDMSTRDTISEILKARTLSALKGLKEDQRFDAKRAAGYDLATGAGGFELAKDVSTLANAEGDTSSLQRSGRELAERDSDP
jgi:hypothetical protein